MANTLVTPDWVTREVARGFTNSVVFLNNVARQYSDEFVQGGAKIGDTTKIRLPQRFEVKSGQALQLQDIFDQTVSLTLNHQKHVDFSWSSAEATTSVDEVQDRYVMPAADALANVADAVCFDTVYPDIYSSVGTPGTTPSDKQTYLRAGVKIDDLAGPPKNRAAVLDTLAMADLVDATTTLFNPTEAISSNYRNGVFGRNQLGCEIWGKTQNNPTHTTGTYTASTPLCNGASQTGSSLITDGWASGATSLKKGDIFVVAGVFSVNPLNYTSTGRLQQFAVTADISDTTGDMTIAISPSIITSGQLQTVSNSPANNAVITVLGATSATAGTLATTVSPQSMVYHKDAFAVAFVDLVRPNAGAKATFTRSKQFGVAIRYVEQFNVATDQNANRLDILFGIVTCQARLACRVQG